MASINRELEFFRTILNYDITNGQLRLNPFNLSKGRKLIERAAKNKRERFPTFGEEMALLRACTGEENQLREHLRPILIIAADTGLRRNELFTQAATRLSNSGKSCGSLIRHCFKVERLNQLLPLRVRQSLGSLYQ